MPVGRRLIQVPGKDAVRNELAATCIPCRRHLDAKLSRLVVDLDGTHLVPVVVDVAADGHRWIETSPACALRSLIVGELVERGHRRGNSTIERQAGQTVAGGSPSEESPGSA